MLYKVISINVPNQLVVGDLWIGDPAHVLKLLASYLNDYLTMHPTWFRNEYYPQVSCHGHHSFAVITNTLCFKFITGLDRKTSIRDAQKQLNTQLWVERFGEEKSDLLIVPEPYCEKTYGGIFKTMFRRYSKNSRSLILFETRPGLNLRQLVRLDLTLKRTMYVLPALGRLALFDLILSIENRLIKLRDGKILPAFNTSNLMISSTGRDLVPIDNIHIRQDWLVSQTKQLRELFCSGLWRESLVNAVANGFRSSLSASRYDRFRKSEIIFRMAVMRGIKLGLSALKNIKLPAARTPYDKEICLRLKFMRPVVFGENPIIRKKRVSSVRFEFS